MIYVEHTIIALFVQLSIGMLTRNWWAAGAIPTAYLIGREFAQAEYRWIEQFGDGMRANMPWWGPFDPQVWTKADQLIDWLGPLVATALVALIASKRNVANLNSERLGP